jgi:hypothetical protein
MKWRLRRARNVLPLLAFHGMGIQRPIETVRGIVNAVWLEEDNKQTATRRFWTHPEAIAKSSHVWARTLGHLVNGG